MFNIRIYGVLINDRNQVLVSDELVRGMYLTKFPGGGLELGEGTRDCLKREFREELNLDVEIGDHIYTTDYYQQSAFNPEHQIISIYYRVIPKEEINAPLRDKPFDFDGEQMKIYEAEGEIEMFRFIDLNEFSPDLLTLPIDKLVASIVKNSMLIK